MTNEVIGVPLSDEVMVDTWGGSPPAIVAVNGVCFSYGGPIESLCTGSHPYWPIGVIVNGIAYWREG